MTWKNYPMKLRRATPPEEDAECEICGAVQGTWVQREIGDHTLYRVSESRAVRTATHRQAQFVRILDGDICQTCRLAQIRPELFLPNSDPRKYAGRKEGASTPQERAS